MTRSFFQELFIRQYMNRCWCYLVQCWNILCSNITRKMCESRQSRWRLLDISSILNGRSLITQIMWLKYNIFLFEIFSLSNLKLTDTCTYTQMLSSWSATFHTFSGRVNHSEKSGILLFASKVLWLIELETEAISSGVTGTDNGKCLLVYTDIFVSQKCINMLSKTQEDGLECFCPITKEIIFSIMGAKLLHTVWKPGSPHYNYPWQPKHCKHFFP